MTQVYALSCDIQMEGREPHGVIISGSAECSDVQEAFIVLLIQFAGCIWRGVTLCLCCSHRIPDVGNV